MEGQQSKYFQGRIQESQEGNAQEAQIFISSHFVDQDEDINTVHGFEDENQLYQALNMRNEHGQFAMCHQHF